MADVGYQYNPKTWSESVGSSTSNTKQTTTSKKVLDDVLLAQILGGLSGQMTDDEIAAYAKSLLDPQLNAGIEAAQQQYDAAKLSREQEIENLAATLAKNISEQQSAYAQNAAAVETAALARGMGRSSYTLQTLSNQGAQLAEAIRMLGEDNARAQNQIQQQISLAAQQNAQTQGRIKTDYASQLAAKMQELKQNQQTAWNQNYMTAVSAALGSQSTMDSATTGANNSVSVSGEVVAPENGNGGGEQKKGGSSSVKGNLFTKVG